MKLWLLRHAKVLSATGLCFGASDLPADAEATRAAARAAAATLPRELPVWVSGLRRARQLADELQALRPDLGTPRCDVRLNEMDFGQWEGRPWADIPRTEFDAWTADFAHHRVGGGESTQQVLTRVATALDDLQALVGASGEALWVTHAGVVRAAMYVTQRHAMPIPSAVEWPTAVVGHGKLLSIIWL